jgi:hypothetical protein
VPPQVVTRDQVLDLLRPFDDHPETVTFVDMGIKVTNVVRRRPTNPALTAPVLAALGLDPKRVVGLIIEPTRITITEHLVDSLGRTYLDSDDQPATATTTIGIQ